MAQTLTEKLEYLSNDMAQPYGLHGSSRTDYYTGPEGSHTVREGAPQMFVQAFDNAAKRLAQGPQPVAHYSGLIEGEPYGATVACLDGKHCLAAVLYGGDRLLAATFRKGGSHLNGKVYLTPELPTEPILEIGPRLPEFVCPGQVMEVLQAEMGSRSGKGEVVAVCCGSAMRGNLQLAAGAAYVLTGERNTFDLAVLTATAGGLGESRPPGCTVVSSALPRYDGDASVWSLRVPRMGSLELTQHPQSIEVHIPIPIEDQPAIIATARVPLSLDPGEVIRRTVRALPATPVTCHLSPSLLSAPFALSLK